MTSARTYEYPFVSAYAWWFRSGRWYSVSMSSVVAEFISRSVSRESGSGLGVGVSAVALVGARPVSRNRAHASADAARKYAHRKSATEKSSR